MRVEFLGSTSETGDCPSAWRTDRGTYLVQGSRVHDPEALAELRTFGNGIPDHETVVEIPAGMLEFLRQDAG